MTTSRATLKAAHWNPLGGSSIGANPTSWVQQKMEMCGPVGTTKVRREGLDGNNYHQQESRDII